MIKRVWLFSPFNKASAKQRGFTFAELLAALVFTAIVIPVSLEGVAIANRAAVYSERRMQAVQLGTQLLNQMITLETWQSASGEGQFENEFSNYRWKLINDTWETDAIIQLTLVVAFDVQGREYYVRLSTLVKDPNATTNASESSSDSSSSSSSSS